MPERRGAGVTFSGDREEMRDVDNGVKLRVGEIVGGRYRLVREVGRGGMARVYRARHVLMGDVVAVKVLHKYLAEDPTRRERFLREARAANRVLHCNIIEVSELGQTEDGAPYLVMEYIEGESLAELLGHGTLSVSLVIRVARQLARALCHAHEMDIVHRDLKPENVLLSSDGRDTVKLLDFGVAKLLDAPALTASQHIQGTPGYIAPEYLESSTIDHRADFYAYGVLLYELLTGAFPFEVSSPSDYLLQPLIQDAIPVSERAPHVPAAISDFIMRCLERLPEDRFNDAAHLLRGLDEAVKSGHLAFSRADLEPTGFFPALSPDEIATAHEVAVEELLRSTQPLVFDKNNNRETEVPPPPPTTEDAMIRFGPSGVRRWRERFDALDLGARDEQGNIQRADLALLLEQARQTLVNLETCVANNTLAQREIQLHHERSKDARALVGKRLVELARNKSIAKQALQRVQQKRLQFQIPVADKARYAKIQRQLQSSIETIEAKQKRLKAALFRLLDKIDVQSTRAANVAQRGMLRADRLASAISVPLAKVENRLSEV